MAGDAGEEERGDAGRQPEQTVVIGGAGEPPRDQPGRCREENGVRGEANHSDFRCQLEKVIVRVFCAVRQGQRRREEQR